MSVVESFRSLPVKFFNGMILSIGGTIVATVATFHAPLVSGKESTINLDDYRLVFNEKFDRLDVSAHGPGTRWIAHTPWNGDFGDAKFADPEAGFPFTTTDGILRIEARKDISGNWRSGLLASMDANGRGFGLQYGYFEVKAKLPAGPGLWPAFWLDSLIPKNSNDPSIEIDVMEHYGKFPNAYESLLIVWPKDRNIKNHSERHVHETTARPFHENFHTYGASVDPEWIIYYFDRKEYWRVKTPPQHKHKLMILVNLALGSGWPIDQTPSPSYMYVDYIRAYVKN